MYSMCTQSLMGKEHDQLFERVIQFVKQSHSKLQSHKVDHKTPVEKDQVPSFDIRPHSREIPTAALLAGEILMYIGWKCKVDLANQYFSHKGIYMIPLRGFSRYLADVLATKAKGIHWE